MERVEQGCEMMVFGRRLILSYIGENDTRYAQWKMVKYPMLECERERECTRAEKSEMTRRCRERERATRIKDSLCQIPIFATALLVPLLDST